MKYRVLWHSLFSDGPLVFCECRTLMFARLRCWLCHCSASRSKGFTGEKIRWFAIEKL